MPSFQIYAELFKTGLSRIYVGDILDPEAPDTIVHTRKHASNGDCIIKVYRTSGHGKHMYAHFENEVKMNHLMQELEKQLDFPLAIRLVHSFLWKSDSVHSQPTLVFERGKTDLCDFNRKQTTSRKSSTPMDLNLFQSIAVRLLRLIRFLLSKKIYYWDLSLENILLDKQGNIVLCDIGDMCEYSDPYQVPNFSYKENYVSHHFLEAAKYKTKVHVGCEMYRMLAVCLFRLLTGCGPYDKGSTNESRVFHQKDGAGVSELINVIDMDFTGVCMTQWTECVNMIKDCVGLKYVLHG